MAYDEGLAQRVRGALTPWSDTVEKRMFGGIGFMWHGHMGCGVYEKGLIVRVGPERYMEALSEPYTRPFDMTGRPMRGWVVVSSEGCAADRDLRAWVQRGVEFALSLPEK